MLGISKKAVTEADCEDILNESLRFGRPFGIPTTLIDLAARQDSAQIDEKIYQAFITNEDIVARLGKDIRNSSSYKDFCSKARTIVTMANLNMPAFQSMSLHSSGDPAINIVFTRRQNDAGRRYISNGLNIKKSDLPEYPGHDSQWEFFSLWHEYAHGAVGSNESAAEELAALVCRSVFNDCAFVYARADLRAVQPVMHYTDTEIVDEFCWGCVESIDQVLRQPPTASDASIEARVKIARMIPRNNREGAICDVGCELRQTANLLFGQKNHSLETMADVADSLVRNNSFSNLPDHQIIAQRFAQGARRLAIGKDAYKSRPNP